MKRTEVRLNVRVTAEQKQAMQRKANADTMSLSTWIRHTLMQAVRQA